MMKVYLSIIPILKMSQEPSPHTYTHLIAVEQSRLDMNESGIIIVYDNEENKFLKDTKETLCSLLGEKSYDAGEKIVCYSNRYFLANWVL